MRGMKARWLLFTEPFGFLGSSLPQDFEINVFSTGFYYYLRFLLHGPV